MLHKKGFTLIELLVVIAIITILAATVAPRVSNWISRGRMARAASEIRNADLALTKMLADADRKNFGQFFSPAGNGGGAATFAKGMEALMSTQNIYAVYSRMFYELLRRGKDADFNPTLSSDGSMLKAIPDGYVLDPSVKKKLGTSYMEIGNDPWNNPYVFYAGPTLKQGLMGFRGYRGVDPLWYYNDEQKLAEDRKIRGNPPADGLQGYPSARDLPVYIYSWGEDRTQGQYINIIGLNLVQVLAADTTYVGGGDDINNWDSTSGWGELY